MAKEFQHRTTLWLALVGLYSHSIGAAPVPEEPRFDIARFELSGNSVLPSAELDAALTPFVGPGRRFADVEAARQAVLAAYVGKGYSAVQVALPEQEITQGSVRLEVRENRIGQVTQLGARHHDAANLRASLPALREGEVPNTLQLAEDLRLANANPAKLAQVMFKSGRQAGLVDAVLRVEDTNPVKTFLTLDSSGNAETGEARLGLGWQHANLFNRDQVLTLQYLTSPSQPDDVAIFGAGWHLPLYGQGGAVDVHAGYSNVDSGTLADLFQVSGRGVLLGARYTLNLVQRGPAEHSLVLGLDYRAYRSDVLDQQGTQWGNQITVRPVSLGWEGQWQDRAARASWHAGVSRNLPGGSHGDAAAFAANRSGAEPDYLVLRLGGGYARTFAGDWQASLAVEAQYSDSPLVSGEQFGLGGLTSVRGFGERVASGDRGWRAGVEINTPALATGLEGAHLRLAGFVEGGSLQRLQPQAGETAETGLASVGLGLRFAWRRSDDSSLSARIDYGHVIDGAAGKEPGDGRWHLALNWSF